LHLIFKEISLSCIVVYKSHTVVVVWTKWNTKDCFNKPGVPNSAETHDLVFECTDVCVSLMYIPSFQRASLIL